MISMRPRPNSVNRRAAISTPLAHPPERRHILVAQTSGELYGQTAEPFHIPMAQELKTAQPCGAKDNINRSWKQTALARCMKNLGPAANSPASGTPPMVNASDLIGKQGYGKREHLLHPIIAAAVGSNSIINSLRHREGYCLDLPPFRVPSASASWNFNALVPPVHSRGSHLKAVVTNLPFLSRRFGRRETTPTNQPK